MEEEKVAVIDTLEGALVWQYGRLKGIIDAGDSKSDEYKNAEREMTNVIEEMGKYYKNCCDYCSKEDALAIEKEHNERMREIEEKKMEEHAKIERDRNEASIKLEQEKQNITWKKVAFEFGKIVVPAVISAAVYFKAQKNVLFFEENGRISSTAGRELHFPKLFK